MSPVFRHGGLRLYLLKLLDEAPRHGYDVIRLLQDRFLGVYSPSPGTIYPRLARLEAEGLVTHETVDGRKIYRITEAGRAELHRKMDDLTALEEELSASVRDIARELTQDVRETVRSLRDELTSAVREAGRTRPARTDSAQTDSAQAGSGQAGSGQAGSGQPDAGRSTAEWPGQPQPDRAEPGPPKEGQREPERPGPDEGEPKLPGSDGPEPGPGSSHRAGGPGWRDWSGQAEQQDWRRFATWARQDWRDWASQAERDWSRWAEDAQRQWQDIAGPAGWPDRDWPGWRDRISGHAWSGAAGAANTDGMTSDNDSPADDAPGQQDAAGPDTGHRGPDLAAELLRLAADFLRDVHRAIWQHAGALGEESAGKLGDILTDALERIGREVFAAPGAGHHVHWPASSGPAQPPDGSARPAASPGSASGPPTGESH